MPRKYSGDNRINVRVDLALKQELRALCADLGRSETDIVEAAIGAAVRHWKKRGGLMMPFDVMPRPADVAKQAAYLDSLGAPKRRHHSPERDGAVVRV